MANWIDGLQDRYNSSSSNVAEGTRREGKSGTVFALYLRVHVHSEDEASEI